MPIDFSTEHGQRALNDLKDELSIWLITVSLSGEPQPNPVWFIWEDDSFLIWTQPKSRRIANIQANPKVSLAFSTDDVMDEIAVFNGIAEIDESVSRSYDHAEYTAKYKDHLAQLGADPIETGDNYSTVIRVRPSRMRGY